MRLPTLEEQRDIRLMRERGLLQGEYNFDTIGIPPKNWLDRGNLCDCRGTLIVHPNSYWGYGIKTLTMSHNISEGAPGEAAPKTVMVDEGAWICAWAILYNCHIMHHAVVACGSVVRSIAVEPWTMVEGNPARPIKRFENGKWVRL